MSYTKEECRHCNKYKKYLKYRESKRKYESSNIYVNSIDDLLNNEWFIWNGLTKHKTFFLNQQLSVILNWIGKGIIFIAKLKDKVGD